MDAAFPPDPRPPSESPDLAEQVAGFEAASPERIEESEVTAVVLRSGVAVRDHRVELRLHAVDRSARGDLVRIVATLDCRDAVIHAQVLVRRRQYGRRTLGRACDRLSL